MGDGCIVVDDISRLQAQLEQAQAILADSKPVAIAFHPDILSQQVQVDVPPLERPRGFDQVDADRFVHELPALAQGRRVIVYVGAEAARCPGITKLTTELGMKAFQNPDEVGAAAVDYLRICGHLVFGYFWARMAKIALEKQSSGDPFYKAKLATARFYFAKLLPETASLIRSARAGLHPLMAMDEALF